MLLSGKSLMCMEDLRVNLKKYFGYDSFRPLQEEIIRHFLDGKDALVLMPTGGGKSICFQLPALMMDGVTVVISTLISLMKDQVDMLCSNGVAAATINSSLDAEDVLMVQKQCLNGTLKLLYLSPERLQSDLMWLKRHVKVSFLVVDEAHCISTWGHDFRPEYTQLGQLHEDFPGVPVAAFTATADKVTRDDILEQLHLRGGKTFISSFDRPNLSLSVIGACPKKGKLAKVLEIIGRHPEERGIIYCMTRRTTEEVAESLLHSGVNCASYHAGMDADERSRVQEDFKNDRIDVVVATVAFGMGIDKPDVRFVVHYNIPGSIESFFQEIGRGGRDGLPCETVLFYNLQDIVTRRRFAEESGLPELNREKLRHMQDYAESTVCRRRILLNYFGETASEDCGNCDVCANPPQRFDGTLIVQKMLSAIVRTSQRISSTVAIDILCGTASQSVQKRGFDRLKTFGVGADVSREDWKAYLLQMIHLGFVEVDVLHYRNLLITPLGQDVLFGRRKAILSVPQHKDFRVKRSKRSAEREAGMPTNSGQLDAVPGRQGEDPRTLDDSTLFEALRQLRTAIAREEKMPAYVIMHDKTLRSICSNRPTTLEAFGECFGIGEAKQKKYGPRFLECIRKHIEGAQE